jgi:hypothetical protein
MPLSRVLKRFPKKVRSFRALKMIPLGPMVQGCTSYVMWKLCHLINEPKSDKTEPKIPIERKENL